MKNQLIISLLVVCVGLPVVAMGTYYVCDNFPVAEEMRKREAQAKEDMLREAERIEEQLRQRGRAAKGVEEEDGIGESQKPVTARGTDAGNVTIKGVSINLPYEQLKQELAKKFGGIKKESEECPGHATETGNDDFDSNFNRFTKGVEFNDPPAFGDEKKSYVFLSEKGWVMVYLVGQEYRDALITQYGAFDFVKNFYYHATAPLNLVGFDVKGSTFIKVANDGLIIYSVDDNPNNAVNGFASSGGKVIYLNSAARSLYLQCEEKKRQKKIEEDAREKAEEEERERKRKARDAGGI